MTKQQLEHIIRAAGSITDEKVILILGSQSILGSATNLSAKLLLSSEADVYPLKAPDKMELINGSIGEISKFHETFGYYAHGIPPAACPLPSGWEKRLNPIRNENTNGITGLCLNTYDLASSKLAAGRPKDLDFVTEMLITGIITSPKLRASMVELQDLDHRLAAQRSFQIVESRLRFLEISESNHGNDREKSDDRTMGRDELSP